MQKKLSLLTSLVLLSGCGIMPGMDNLNTNSLEKYIVSERIDVHPTLIPITPSLIADQRVNTYFYRIAPSDVLNITVWQHPEFLIEAPTLSASGPSVQGAAGQPGYLVNARGDIYFPLIQYVHVANKTVDEVRSEIMRRLQKYVPNPQVNVRVADFRGQKVYIVGEVNKIGFLPINDQQLTIAGALALSGWMNNDSDPRYIYIIRGNYVTPEIFWLNAKTPDRLLLAEHFSLQPQDVLYVSSAPITRWNRVLNQLLPTIQTIWYTQAVVNNA